MVFATLGVSVGLGFWAFLRFAHGRRRTVAGNSSAGDFEMMAVLL